MFARNVRMQLKPNTSAQFTQTLEKEIIPMLRKQDGFQDEVTFIVPGGAEVVAISFWQSKEKAEAYSRTGYPEVLKAAGIAGKVVVQFVVDTTGHVDPNSFKLISAPHPAFANSAKELVTKSVFRPGKMRGQAVAVLVQQSINFTP